MSYGKKAAHRQGTDGADGQNAFSSEVQIFYYSSVKDRPHNADYHCRRNESPNDKSLIIRGHDCDGEYSVSILEAFQYPGLFCVLWHDLSGLDAAGRGLPRRKEPITTVAAMSPIMTNLL